MYMYCILCVAWKQYLPLICSAGSRHVIYRAWHSMVSHDIPWSVMSYIPRFIVIRLQYYSSTQYIYMTFRHSHIPQSLLSGYSISQYIYMTFHGSHVIASYQVLARLEVWQLHYHTLCCTWGPNGIDKCIHCSATVASFVALLTVSLIPVFPSLLPCPPFFPVTCMYRTSAAQRLTPCQAKWKLSQRRTTWPPLPTCWPC